MSHRSESSPNDNRDELFQVIKSEDWNKLAEVLTKLSADSSTLSTIKWSSLISDENQNKKQRDSIRKIFISWASDDSQESKLNVRGIAKSASNDGKGAEEAVEKLRAILNDNKDQITQWVQSDDWESVGNLLEEQSKGSAVLSSFRWKVLLSDNNKDESERESMRKVLKTWANNGGKLDIKAGSGGSGSIKSLLSPLMGMFSFASGSSSSSGGGSGGGLGGGLGGLDLKSLGLGGQGFGSLLSGLGGGGGLGSGLSGLTGGLGGLGGMLGGGGGSGGGLGGGLGSLTSGLGGLGGMLGGGGGGASGGSHHHRGSHHSSSGGSSGGMLGGMLGWWRRRRRRRWPRRRPRQHAWWRRRKWWWIWNFSWLNHEHEPEPFQRRPKTENEP